MKKKIIIGLIIIVVVGAAAFFLMKKKPDYQKMLTSKNWKDQESGGIADLKQVVSIDKSGTIKHVAGIVGKFINDRTIQWSSGHVWVAG